MAKECGFFIPRCVHTRACAHTHTIQDNLVTALREERGGDQRVFFSMRSGPSNQHPK